MARLVLPNILVGLGAGATIPFLNVFVEGKFNIDYASLGSLFAWTSLATAATALLLLVLVAVALAVTVADGVAGARAAVLSLLSGDDPAARFSTTAPGAAR